MEWIIRDETPVHRTPWVTVNAAKVELPDGRLLDYTVVREKDAALCIAVNEHNQALLIWRHRFIPNTWGWEAPGGGIDDGEDPAEAAAREMLEETGWRATGEVEHLLSVEPANGIMSTTYHVYWARGAEHVGEPVDAEESVKREWVDLARVPELIAAGEIRGADTVAGLMVLLHRLNTEEGQSR